MALLYAAEGVAAVTSIAKNVFDIDVSVNQNHPGEKPIYSFFVAAPSEPVPVTSGAAVMAQPPPVFWSYVDQVNDSLDGK